MSDVEIARDGAVARVTLNRPQLHNAFDEALIQGLTDAFAALGEDAGVRVVLLTGAGKSFSAGADLNWMKRASTYDEERNRADARALELMLRTIDECPKPVIAMVNGAAAGLGLVHALFADVRIANAIVVPSWRTSGPRTSTCARFTPQPPSNERLPPAAPTAPSAPRVTSATRRSESGW